MKKLIDYFLSFLAIAAVLTAVYVGMKHDEKKYISSHTISRVKQ